MRDERFGVVVYIILFYCLLINTERDESYNAINGT